LQLKIVIIVVIKAKHK